jgi:uncharacterized protein (TIGR02145 family)
MGATVTLKQGEDDIGEQTTDNTGDYIFNNVLQGNYTISVSKNIEPASHGLNDSDIVLIRRLAAGLDSYNTYKRIVSNIFIDPSNLYSINDSDLVKLRRKLAMLDPSLPVGIWKFFSSDSTVTEGNYLEESLYTRTINNLSSNLNNQDFTAYKMGDVNNDWGEFAPIQGCGASVQIQGDDESYGTVQIGNQCWMTRNLNVGNPIAYSPTNNSVVEKRCYGNHPDNCDKYGGLYQWDEMMNYATNEGAQGICPSGWHIPTLNEWNILMSQLGGNEEAGGAMKETGLEYWNSPNTGATNESYFSAKGSGYYINSFGGLNSSARFWTSKQTSGSNSNGIRLLSTSTNSLTQTLAKSGYYSVRCIKDN